MINPYLFLDIDGVLHPYGTAYQDHKGNVKGEDLFRWLPLFLGVVKDFPKLKIILHSSWRFCFNDETQLRANLPKELNELIVATTNPEFTNRYTSIKHYIAENKIENFVIIDDELAPFKHTGVRHQLVLCDETKGLSDPNTLATLRKKLEKICSEPVKSEEPPQE